MQEIFKQFDRLVQYDMESFLNSAEDILVVHGENGCGKSELTRIATEGRDELIFQHSCFEFSTINDFLLNFFDAFKNYALQKKISLKKAVTNQFSTKIISYFQETDKNFIITVDNFEQVSEKKDIVDFLLHIASFKNVKLIILSTIAHDFGQGWINTIEIKPNSKELIERKIKMFQPFASQIDADAFYEATGGSELFLRMSIGYLKTSGTNLSDFINEFKTKKLSFQDFLVNKIVTLIPETYYQTMKNFALLFHPSTKEFLKNHSIAKLDEVEYLVQKMAISESTQGYYLRKYLKDFFLNKFSVQEKISGHRKMVIIYEKELAKSPSERLLRLSRESIRALADHYSSNLPKVNFKMPQNMSYMSQANIKWENVPTKEEVIETKTEQIKVEDYLEQAEEYEKAYNYQKAAECLIQAKFANTNSDMLPKILLKLAKVYTTLDQLDLAISTEVELSDTFKNTNEPKYYASLYRIGLIYKNKFNHKMAREYFDKILSNKEKATKLTLGKTYLALGEITGEKEFYEKAVETLQIKIDEKTLPVLTSAYFKIAQIYDNQNDFKSAKEYYLKNISVSKNWQNNEELGLAYLNLGDILSDENDDKAIQYYLSAEEVFKKTNNLEELYFIQEKLAQSYKYRDGEKYYSYLESTKDTAKKIKDDFKIAFCLVEIGDYFYKEKQNGNALINFLEAKKALGEDSEENLLKINSRIEDMKIKMGENEFNGIVEIYE